MTARQEIERNRQRRDQWRLIRHAADELLAETAQSILRKRVIGAQAIGEVVSIVPGPSGVVEIGHAALIATRQSNTADNTVEWRKIPNATVLENVKALPPCRAARVQKLQLRASSAVRAVLAIRYPRYEFAENEIQILVGIGWSRKVN